MRRLLKPLRRECDREDVTSREGVVLHNFLQAPEQDADGPWFPPTETTDPWAITDGAVENA